MIRPCYLCGGEVEVLSRARWSLPGLAPREPLEIGFGCCVGCGLVLQSPTVEPEEMRRFYAESAVYTAPGRGGAPSERKMRGLERNLASVRQALGGMPESAFQVGSSDGYTLARFREAGVARVLGIDPGPTAAAIARERGVETAVGHVEDLGDPPDAELWILTHVLEHLLDPLALLRRAREETSRAPWLLVEVPLLERPERLPPGYLAFEHLSYFTEDALVRLLSAAGYEPVRIDKEYADDIYPVVAAVARPSEGRAEQPLAPRPGERERGRERLRAILERERALWERADRHLAREIEPGSPVWLYGAGIFATQVLASTGLAERARIAGVLDSAPHKRGSRLGELRVHAPGDVPLSRGDCVVVTSFASADEIWRALEPERERGVRVVRLPSPHGTT